MQGLDGTRDLFIIHSYNEWDLLSLVHSFLYQIVLKQHAEPGTKPGPRNTMVNEDTLGPCPHAASVHYNKLTMNEKINIEEPQPVARSCVTRKKF